MKNVLDECLSPDDSRLVSLEAKPIFLQTHRKRAIRIEEDKTEEQIEEEISIHEVVEEEGKQGNNSIQKP